MSIAGVRALTFDVFGTVVDWRKSVIHEVTAMELRAGALGWTNIDALHRMILDELIERHSLQTMTEPQRGPRSGPTSAAVQLRNAPEAVMMVAAHKSGVQAARELELKTAFVERPAEHGADSKPDKERAECMKIVKLGVAA